MKINKSAVLSLIITGTLFLSACGSATGSVADTAPTTGTVAETDVVAETGISETEATTEIKNNETINVVTEESTTTELTFAELSGQHFTFCSGVGAWSTDLEIENDGYFMGEYHDSDMGDTGDGYPDGTYYLARFSGQFSELEKVDDYTYKCTLEDLTYRDEEGEEIMDGMRYVYSEAYGICGGDDYYFHCPGKSMSDLSEDVHSWIDMAAGDEEKLGFYVLENAKPGQAFTSYERMSVAEEADELMTFCENSYKAISDDMKSKDMNQVEFNFTAKLLYEETDYCLNRLWNLVKHNLDEAKFEEVLNEQREWIKQRDTEVEEYTKDYKDGSLYGLIYYQEMADYTMQRCCELTDLLIP